MGCTPVHSESSRGSMCKQMYSYPMGVFVGAISVFVVVTVLVVVGVSMAVAVRIGVA